MSQIIDMVEIGLIIYFVFFKIPRLNVAVKQYQKLVAMTVTLGETRIQFQKQNELKPWRVLLPGMSREVEGAANINQSVEDCYKVFELRFKEE